MDIDWELPFSLNAALEHIAPFPPFPPEILLTIFDLAYTNPKTALTLCLVSKHFNALATPLLFRSISVCGREEMLEFADRLEENPHIPPMVRHLFLSQCGPRDPTYAPHPDDILLLSHVCRQIITLLSPFLETLSYIVPSIADSDHLVHVFATPLPHLRELTIEPDFFKFPIPIPSLERLHVYMTNPYSMICDLREPCPRLTHLKLTNLAYDGESIEIGLKRNLGILRETWEFQRAEIVAPLCLPSLHLLILQPSGFPPAIPGFSSPGEDRLRRLWQRLARLGEAGLGPTALLLEEPMQKMRYRTQAYGDWLDRLECGEGCWKLREALNPYYPI